MSDLFRRLRRLIGDADSETWDDADLEDALQGHALLLPGVGLDWTPATDGTNGVVYHAPYGNFGAAVLRSANGQTLTATSFDLGRGVWHFDTAPGQTVYLTGTSYDLSGAAADLLETELATLRRKFDTTDASGATMKRNQEFTSTEALIKRYRAKQRVVSISSVRSDVG